MSNNAKENIIEFIKQKESFSIPMIQKDLSLDYGVIRDIVSDLEDEEKITFLEGIVYKWSAPKKKEDEGENDGNPLGDLFSDTPKRRPSRPKKIDEEENDEDKEEKDDFDIFIDSILSSHDSDADNIFKKGKLLESNGGPLPEYPEDDLTLIQYVALQRTADGVNNAFLPKLDIHIPEIDKQLVIHTSDTAANCFFHDNGLLEEYIKSRADGLEEDAVSLWHDLMEGRISEIGAYGSYSDGLFKYYVYDSAPYDRYEDNLSTLLGSISKSVEYVKMTLKKKRAKDLMHDFRNIRPKHDDIANKVLGSDISFDDLTEFIQKVVEIEPSANSETVSRVSTKCFIKAVSGDMPKRSKIIDFCTKIRHERQDAITVYFLLDEIGDILDSDN